MKKEPDAELVAARAALAGAEQTIAELRGDLATLKASVGWTMDTMKIYDLFRQRGDNGDAKCTDLGYLPNFTPSPDDTARIEWINKHGRAGRSQRGDFVFTVPGVSDSRLLEIQKNDEGADFPVVRNIRHIIDLARLEKPYESEERE